MLSFLFCCAVGRLINPLWGLPGVRRERTGDATSGDEDRSEFLRGAVVLRAAAMDFSAAPAPFLPSAGAEPAIAWPRWVRMYDNFLCAIGGDGFPPGRKQAILLTCLGAEGQRIHESLPPCVKLEEEDDFMFTRRRLEAHFAPRQNVCVTRYRFRSRGQIQGESTLSG